MWIYLAAGFWALIAGIQAQIAWNNRSILPLLLAIESALVFWRLLNRKEDAGAPQPWYVTAIAWASVFLPMGIASLGPAPIIVSILSGAGIVLTIWAITSLGQSFGIAPADRGLVTRGPYRILRHPMYAGALLNAGAVVAWTPSALNIGLLVLIIASIVFRVYIEEKMIAGYSEYAAAVRWRVIPFVW